MQQRGNANAQRRRYIYIVAPLMGHDILRYTHFSFPIDGIASRASVYFGGLKTLPCACQQQEKIAEYSTRVT